MKRILLISSLLHLCIVMSAQVFEQTQVFSSPDLDEGDHFGREVKIDGDIAVFGTYHEDHNLNGNDSLDFAGSAYIYIRNSSGDWVFDQKLVANKRDAGDFYGSGVAVWGDYVFIAAVRDGDDENESNFVTIAGSVYIYKRDSIGNWSFFQKIVSPNRGVVRQFGADIDIYNGKLIVACRPNSSNPDLHVFELLNGSWTLTHHFYSNQASGDFISCAISNETVICGSYSSDEYDTDSSIVQFAGNVRVFELDSNGVYSQVAKFTAPVLVNQGLFALNLDIEDDVFVVSHARDRLDSNNLDTLINAGAAFIYEKDNGTWQLKQKLTALNRAQFAFFGNNVAISNQNILISSEWGFGIYCFQNPQTSYTRGNLNLYKRPNGNRWQIDQIFTYTENEVSDCQDLSEGMAYQDDKIVIGAPGNFTLDGEVFSNAGLAFAFEDDSVLCEPPNNLAMVNPLPVSVTLSWTPPPSSTSTIISGARLGISNPLTIEASNASFKATNLDANQNYFWRAKSVCNSRELSACWSEPDTFRAPECDKVSVQGITINSNNIVKLFWGGLFNHDGFVIRGGLLDSPEVKITVLGSVNLSVGQLPPGTYRWKINAYCDIPALVSSGFTDYDTFTIDSFTASPKHDLYSNDQIEVYPNPASNNIYIAGINQEISYQLYDLKNQLLAEGRSKTIDVAHLANGMYSLRIKTEDGIATRKVVINH